ncbi:MAG TPA: NfeD family protein [Solirubrobacterales bacterium]|jgi:membrane protein implicated in regulation of membrane protease activity|nr:NfeD family protein [Solirubrobacterales bacterium]
MPDWSIWMVIAVALAVGEIIVFSGFILAPLAMAALITAVAAAFEASAELQLAIFAGASILSLGLLRPIARRHLDMPPETRTGAAALVGLEAKVLKTITSDDPGLIRLANENWTAAPIPGIHQIEEGAYVIVEDIAGATAIVRPATDEEARPDPILPPLPDHPPHQGDQQ